MTQAQVRIDDGLILAMGEFPAGSPDSEFIEIVDLTEEQLADIAAGPPGDTYLEANGDIRIDPAPPPDPILSSRSSRDAEIVTTDATPAILYRHPVPVQTAFDLQVLVIAIDTGNGASKKWKREGFIKRLGTAAKPVVIGTITNPLGLDPGDPATVDWTMVPSFQENDLIITVTGAAGRTLAWQTFIDVLRFTPSGI